MEHKEAGGHIFMFLAVAVELARRLFKQPRIYPDLASENGCITGYRRILSPSESRCEGDGAAFRVARTLPVTRRSRYIGICSYPPTVFCRPLLRSDLHQASPERDRNRMRPVVGLQFIYQVLDVEVNRVLRNGQLIGDLFVSMAIANEPENVHSRIVRSSSPKCSARRDATSGGMCRRPA